MPRNSRTKCFRNNYYFGWRCTRGIHFDNPCALVPKWWNVNGRWQSRAGR